MPHRKNGPLRRLLTPLLMLLCCVALGSCALLPSFFGSLFSSGKSTASNQYAQSALQSYKSEPAGPKVNLGSVTILSEVGANNDSAITIHAVAVTEPSVLSMLMNMPARTYFANLNQMRARYPGMFQITPWQLVPGQSLINQRVNVPKTTIAQTM